MCESEEVIVSKPFEDKNVVLRYDSDGEYVIVKDDPSWDLYGYKFSCYYQRAGYDWKDITNGIINHLMELHLKQYEIEKEMSAKSKPSPSEPLSLKGIVTNPPPQSMGAYHLHLDATPMLDQIKKHIDHARVENLRANAMRRFLSQALLHAVSLPDNLGMMKSNILIDISHAIRIDISHAIRLLDVEIESALLEGT